MQKSLKKYCVIPVLIFIGAAFISCKQTLFKSIHLKADPAIKLSLGEKTIKADDYLSAKSLVKHIENEEMLNSTRIFDYRKDDTGRLLIYYPITDLKLNMDNYLTVLKDVEKNISKTLERRSFTFPTLRKKSQAFDNLLTVSGASLPQLSIPIGQIEIPFNKADQFVEAHVRSGEIEITAKIFSSNNVVPLDVNYSDLTVKQDGASGLNAAFTTNTLDLSGKIVNNNNFILSGTVVIKAQDVSYNAGDKIILSFNPTINKLDYAKLQMDEDFNPEYKHEEPVSRDLRDWVATIHFNKVSVAVSIDNRLPEGNDITVIVSSKALASDTPLPSEWSDSAIFSTGSITSQEIKKENFDFYPRKCPDDKLDFHIDVKFNGYDGDAKLLTVKNIEPGKAVSFGGSVKVTPDWDTAVIKPSNTTGASGSYPKNGKDFISLGAISDLKKKGIKFEGAIAHLYARSEYLKNESKKITGNFFASYMDTTTNERKRKDFLGKENEYAEIYFCKTLPDFSLETENGSIYSQPLPDAEIFDISDVFELNHEKLRFEYTLQVESLTVHKADINKDADASIKACIVIELPLIVSVADEIVIEKFANDKDILNRSSKTENEQLDTGLEYLECIKLHIDYNNPLGMPIFSMKLRMGQKKLTMKFN